MTFSIRKLLRRADNSSPRERAQALVDEGIAAERSGLPVQALARFEDAVLADASFAAAHMNRGIALLGAGRVQESVESHRQAIACDPGYAAAHYNLALAHATAGQPAAAEAAFRAAITCRGDFAEAWVGLAGQLESQGRDDDALAALHEALRCRPDYAGALVNAGSLLRKMHRLDEAIANDRRIVELEPENHLVHYRLANTLRELGRFGEAEAAYRQALLFAPDDADIATALGLLLNDCDRPVEAIPWLFKSVAGTPRHVVVRCALALALRGNVLNVHGDLERDVLRAMCLDDDVSPLFLASAVLDFIQRHEGFAHLREIAITGRDCDLAEDALAASFLRDPLLLVALPRMPFTDETLEAVLTCLRRHLLLRTPTDDASPANERCRAAPKRSPPRGEAARSAASGGTYMREGPPRARISPAAHSAEGSPSPGVPIEFACALARSCFFSAYALFADDEELVRLAALRDRLERALAQTGEVPRSLEMPLAVYAAYASLGTLAGWQRLVDTNPATFSSAFAPLVVEQIADRIREQALAAALPAVAPVTDPISVAVRAQYEENPFPRWVAAPNPGVETCEALWQRLHKQAPPFVLPRPVPVLVAGCGTGHHPVMVARNHPDADILAVDLSRASLGYAARMTAKLGVPNIRYCQGDILELSALRKKFPLIECAGVLHHMRDPMAGWRVLRGLLEPFGLMKIALYSERARADLAAAREFIAGLGLPPTADGLRACRRAILKLPREHPARAVVGFHDFYTLDEFRDLVVHVQEHRFTLPQIGRCLEELDLRLLEIDTSAATRSAFAEMFPGKDAGTDLAAWDRFEEAHPRTFISMYVFWCCPK